MISSEILAQLSAIVGADNMSSDEKSLTSGSRDCYYFSPVLVPQLDNKIADVIVRPQTQVQLKAIIQLAVSNNIPVTPRGGGTGNYGQGVPLAGGIMVNTRRMDRLIDINAEHALVEGGASLWQLEKAAREAGGELRMFPSTITSSSSAGFITGGSGGVGSIEWGMLSEPGNIRSAKILTIEAEPREILLDTPEKLQKVLHNCGLTAFVTEVDFALAPRTEWHQYILAFDNIDTALYAGEQLAYDDSLHKRLCSVMEWPIPACFKPLVNRGACPEGKSLLFLITELDPNALSPYIKSLGGTTSFYQPPEPGPSRGFQIYDFTWNHTTLWAMKADPQLTYLQDGFDRERFHEQVRLRKEKYGDQIHLHIEFLKVGGQVKPGGLSIVRFQDRDQLWDIIDYCETIGIRIANPHTHFLDDDPRWYNDQFLNAKQEWDPHGLLNPGHLKALEAEV